MSICQGILITLIKAYQVWISPIFPSSCRFIPTCSDYTREALMGHGIKQGIKLGLKRLIRCHPFHRGGFDPAPPMT